MSQSGPRGRGAQELIIESNVTWGRHCTHQTSHCTLHASHFTLHTVHCKLHTAHCTLQTSHCTPNTARCTLHNTGNLTVFKTTKKQHQLGHCTKVAKLLLPSFLLCGNQKTLLQTYLVAELFVFNITCTPRLQETFLTPLFEILTLLLGLVIFRNKWKEKVEKSS